MNNCFFVYCRLQALQWNRIRLCKLMHEQNLIQKQWLHSQGGWNPVRVITTNIKTKRGFWYWNQGGLLSILNFLKFFSVYTLSIEGSIRKYKTSTLTVTFDETKTKCIWWYCVHTQLASIPCIITLFSPSGCAAKFNKVLLRHIKLLLTLVTVKKGGRLRYG